MGDDNAIWEYVSHVGGFGRWINIARFWHACTAEMHWKSFFLMLWYSDSCSRLRL